MKTVKFKIYGKKMQATIDAKTHSEAKEFIKNKIVFHEISNTETTNTKLAKDFICCLRGCIGCEIC
jgi:hypothetical protein